jgi:hypothetical protein
VASRASQSYRCLSSPVSCRNLGCPSGKTRTWLITAITWKAGINISKGYVTQFTLVQGWKLQIGLDDLHHGLTNFFKGPNGNYFRLCLPSLCSITQGWCSMDNMQTCSSKTFFTETDSRPNLANLSHRLLAAKEITLLKLGVVVHSCNFSYIRGIISRRIEVWCPPGKKFKTVWKITTAKRAGAWLKWQSSFEVLSSNPSTEEKK